MDCQDSGHISKKVMRAAAKWKQKEGDGTSESQSYQEYRRYIYWKWIFIAICLVIIFVVAGVAITVGAYNIGFLESYQILIDHILGNAPADTTKDYVVVTLRTPRVVVGIVTGAGLAVAGAVMQSTLLNPLADPYTTGVSSGASFGATLAMTAGVSITGGSYAIVGNAFFFALIPTAMILGVSRMKNSSPTTMIMAGIAVMYIFNAMTTVLKLWTDPDSLAKLYAWQVGSLSAASWDEIPIMIIVTVACLIPIQLMSKKLNVLATGNDTANALGLDANKMRIILLAIVSLMSAALVSFTGLIGFVGLVVPHIVRIFIGPDNRFLIPASAVAGSALLVAADLAGRVVFAPVVLQVGVVMSFVGGPVFLWLLMRKNSRVW